MEKHKENIIELRNIRSLSGMNFYIPDYQRGYRWTDTQAKQMIHDFLEFAKAEKSESNAPYYCLQPVVVKAKSWLSPDGVAVDGYEVIDGQQRLTTLYLLLTALFYKNSNNISDARGFKLFNITYQTRSDSKQYLENISDNDFRRSKAYECIDFYHLNKVFETFEDEIENQMETGDDRTLTLLITGEHLKHISNEDDDEDDEDDELLADVANNVRIIWYEIGENEKATSEDIFTRLNIGKIPLTNAELIKAMFLKQTNFGKVSSTVPDKEQKAQQLGIALKQNKLAEEWNLIEQKLQREDFWYFLGATSHGKEYETRIEFIFDLMADWNADVEPYHTFNYFQDEIKAAGKKRPAETVWANVIEYFRELEYWHNDRILFHLIGFLIDCGLSIQYIKTLRSKEIEDENGEKRVVELKKDEFLEEIKNEVSNIIKDIEIEELNYSKDKDKDMINKVLLLFNVLSVIENERSDIKFPFDKYKKESWDREHVASQTDKDTKEVPTDNSKRVAWINDMLYYFTGIHGNDAKDEGGEKITDEQLQNEYVIAQVQEYISAEEALARQLNEEDAVSRLKELEIVKKLLEAKVLSGYTSKQRSASKTKDTYDRLMEELFRTAAINFNDNRLPDEAKDGIGNMALLNSHINRAYGNAFFAIKRMYIQDYDSEGVFIPQCTKNVFMKYYSKRVDSMLTWSKSDAEAYRNKIIEKINNFLNKKRNG